MSAANRGRLGVLESARASRPSVRPRRRSCARKPLPGAVALLFLMGTIAISAGEAWGAQMPAMHFGHRVKVATVCFGVTNPAGGQSTLYGLRYTDSRRRVDEATPAIVLVHGIASSTENWDFSPTWSVARALAAAGYVVYSYDRLGYAKSSYFDHPGGGFTLTTAQHRAELHQIVDEVKDGGYTTTRASDCSGRRGVGPGHRNVVRRHRAVAGGRRGAADGHRRVAGGHRDVVRSDRVVIIGHSAGGWIVAGYPGEYHDVAAMIQADINGSNAQPPAGTPKPSPSTGGGFTPDPNHPDYFEFFQTRQNCEDFNTYPPGEVPYVVQIACTPPFLDSPFGEITDIAAMYAENDASISRIGPSIPVLLTSGEEDTTDPPADANADYAYYKQHCGCDVTQLLLPNTAHLFMVHQTLPIWINDVYRWLRRHGVAPTRRTPPLRCTGCLVPFVR
jgi:pimeloyl-ACP methyl ester carboxylesterase